LPRRADHRGPSPRFPGARTSYAAFAPLLSAKHEPWALYHETPWFWRNPSRPGSGIGTGERHHRAHFKNPRMARELRPQPHSPVVDVPRRRSRSAPSIGSRRRLPPLRRMVGEHLLERGFPSVRLFWHRGRELVRNSATLVFVPRWSAVEAQGSRSTACRGAIPRGRRSWEARAENKPRPAGLRPFPKPRPASSSASDQRGSQFPRSLPGAPGVSVPDDLAVVGVDNDEPLCEVCQPPLSSVEPRTPAGGAIKPPAPSRNALLKGKWPRPKRPCGWRRKITVHPLIPPTCSPSTDPLINRRSNASFERQGDGGRSWSTNSLDKSELSRSVPASGALPHPS